MESNADISYPLGEQRGLAASIRHDRSLSVSLLEHFNYPIVLVDHLLVPVLFNRAAQQIGVITLDGQLELSLHKQVSNFVGGTGNLPALVRMKNSSGAFPTLVQAIAGSERPQYLLTSAAPKNATGANIKAVAAAYRLTSTEIRILRQLLDGKVPKQIAVAHQVALSTIRTQIKHILQKSGVSSVVDLVLFIKSMPDIKDIEHPRSCNDADSLSSATGC